MFRDVGGGIHQFNPRVRQLLGQGPHEVSRAPIASEITVPQSQGPPIGSLTQLGQWVVGQLRAVDFAHHHHLVALAPSKLPDPRAKLHRAHRSPFFGQRAKVGIGYATERQDHRLKVAIPHPFGHQTRQHARARQQPDSAAQSRPPGRRSASSTALARLACMASSSALGSSWT